MPFSFPSIARTHFLRCSKNIVFSSNCSFLSYVLYQCRTPGSSTTKECHYVIYCVIMCEIVLCQRLKGSFGLCQPFRFYFASIVLSSVRQFGALRFYSPLYSPFGVLIRRYWVWLIKFCMCVFLNK